MRVLSFVSKLVSMTAGVGATVVPDILDTILAARNGGHNANPRAVAPARNVDFEMDNDVFNPPAASGEKDAVAAYQIGNEEFSVKVSPDDMEALLNTRDRQFNTDVNTHRSDSDKFSMFLHTMKGLPMVEIFGVCAQNTLRDKGGYTSDDMESKGPRLEKIVSYIYATARDLGASRFDFVAFAARVILNYYNSFYVGDGEEHTYPGSARREYLGGYGNGGLRARTRLFRDDPCKALIDGELQDRFGPMSIRVDFAFYMAALKPTTEPVTFWKVLTNLYVNGGAPLIINGKVDMELAERLILELQLFNRLARYMVEWGARNHVVRRPIVRARRRNAGA
ncbi:hypothetical protein PAPHI01_2097 [Pancytospora philotis]|nr:hypothetical protein PAPHI01_2097 [Pancytospora philotis]